MVLTDYACAVLTCILRKVIWQLRTMRFALICWHGMGWFFCSDKDVYDTVDKLSLQHAMLSHKEFKILEQACGYNWDTRGLLYDTFCREIVKPISHYCHDWMHALSCCGVFHEIFWKWLSAMEGLQDVYQTLGAYVELWNHPESKASKLQPLFTQKRKVSNQKANIWKSSASESLGLLPILCIYIHNVVLKAGLLEAECGVILAFSTIVDLIQAIPLANVLPEQLDAAVQAFYASVKAAHWEACAIPKFHWCRHFGQHLMKFGALPSCFAHERKHKHAKKIAENCNNTIAYEKSIVADFLGQDIFDLQDPDIFSTKARLTKKRKLTKKLEAFLKEHIAFNEGCASNTAYLEVAGQCSKNDVILVATATSLAGGIVWAHVELDTCVYTLVSQLELQSYSKTSFCATWQRTTALALVHTSDIKCSMLWSSAGNNSIVSLVLHVGRPK